MAEAQKNETPVVGGNRRFGVIFIDTEIGQRARDYRVFADLEIDPTHQALNPT